MKILLKAYKTELKPTKKQATKIRKTIGTCRFLYNFYLAENKKAYEEGRPFLTGFEFTKWMNNEFLPENPSYVWIKETSSKASKKAVMNAENAYRNFFKGQGGFPRFKKKWKSNVKAYFPKNNKTDLTVERHRIKIPTLGFVRLKEKGYIPCDAKARNAVVSMRAGRYYVSVLMDIPEPEKEPLNGFGIGIDLGIKSLATCSNSMVFENVNKTERVRKIEKRLRREQRRLSRKLESKKKNKKKGGAAQSNIRKQVLKVQNLHMRLEHIRTDHMNQCIAKIVKTKPSYVVLEDLNVSGMRKNRHLAKAVSVQKLYEFRTKMINVCHRLGIEVRLADRYYPSSKACHACGYIHKGLKLKDRVFLCPSCGYKEDRDFHASLNLRDTGCYVLV